MFKKIFEILNSIFKFKSKFKLEKIVEEITPSEEDGIYEETFHGDSPIDENLIEKTEVMENPFQQYYTVDRRIEKWTDCLRCNHKLFEKGWEKHMITEGDSNILQCTFCGEKYKIIK